VSADPKSVNSDSPPRKVGVMRLLKPFPLHYSQGFLKNTRSQAIPHSKFISKVESMSVDESDEDDDEDIEMVVRVRSPQRLPARKSTLTRLLTGSSTQSSVDPFNAKQSHKKKQRKVSIDTDDSGESDSRGSNKEDGVEWLPADSYHSKHCENGLSDREEISSIASDSSAHSSSADIGPDLRDFTFEYNPNEDSRLNRKEVVQRVASGNFFIGVLFLVSLSLSLSLLFSLSLSLSRQ